MEEKILSFKQLPEDIQEMVSEYSTIPYFKLSEQFLILFFDDNALINYQSSRNKNVEIEGVIYFSL